VRHADDARAVPGPPAVHEPAQCQELIDGLCAIPEQIEQVLKQNESAATSPGRSVSGRTGCSSAAGITTRWRWKAR
jgi:hypothetical protein